MATTTSLGFNIISRFRKEGVEEAEKYLKRLDKSVRDTNQSFKAAGGGLTALATGLLVAGPAAQVLGSSIATVGTAAALSLGAAGAAGTAYGLVLSATVKRVHELKDDGAALNSQQQAYINTVEKLTKRWNDFLTANESKTLSVARDGINGLTAGIARLQPVVDATHPIIKRTSEAWKAWMEGDGSKRFADNIVTYGVPALSNMEQVGRNMLSVLGTGMRDFMPLGSGFTEMLLRASLAARNWATNGGFQQFISYVRENQGLVKEFFEALFGALRNVASALADMAPVSLKLITIFLQMIAAMPTEAIHGLIYALVALRTIVLINAAIGAFVAALGSVVSVVGMVTTVLGWLSTAVTTFVVHLRILSVAMGVTSGPIGWVILALGLLVAAIVWIATKTDWFQKAWTFVWNGIKDVTKVVVDWLVNTWNTVWPWIKDTAKVVWDWMVTAWQFTIGSLILGAKMIVDWFTSWWNPMWNGIKSTAGAVWDWMVSAWGVVSTFFLDAYRGFIQPVIDAFRNVWPEIQQAVKNAWDHIVSVFETAWKFIGPIVEVGWALIKIIFETGFGMLKAVTTASWDVLVSIFKFVWDVIGPIVQFGWDLIVTIFNTAVTILGAALKMFATIFMAIWEPLWGVVSAIFVAVWENAKAIWRVFVDVVEAILLTFLAIFTGNWDKALNAINDVWVSIWNAIKVFGESIWNVIKAVFVGFLNFTQDVWQAVWTFVKTFFVATWDAIVSFVNSTLTLIKDIFSAALQFLKDLWTAVWTGIRDFFVATFNGLKDFISVTWDVIKAVFQAFVDWVLTTFWNPLRDFFGTTLPNSFRDAVDAIGRFWEGLKSKIMEPVKWVVNVVWNDGLREGWNWINDLWDGPNIDRFSLPFATGGPVRGPGTGTSDSIPARLSNGEHVWTKREVDAAGGHRAVAGIRSAVLGGDAVRAMGNTAGFAEGGGFDWSNLFTSPIMKVSVAGLQKSLSGFTKFTSGLKDTANGAGGYATKMVGMAKGVSIKAIDAVVRWVTNKLQPPSFSGGWQQMWDIVRNQFPDASLTSALRPGDPGYHGKGQAIDVAWPMTSAGQAKMMELNKWIASSYPNSTQLIHTPGINLLNGKPFTYDQPTRDGHWDHVHWAMAGMGGGAPGNVQGWRDLVVQELGHFGRAADAGLVDLVLRRMNQESGGNPSAVNNWDVNAKNGTPSKGLMQVIDPTFNAYKNTALHPDNIWDPGANVHASMNYANSRYGSLETAYSQPGGYFLGTRGAHPGIHNVAERGMELITRGPTPVRFRGGEKVWNSRDTADLIGGGKGGDVVIENVNFDLRGATPEAIDKAKSELPGALRKAIRRGTGKRHGG